MNEQQVDNADSTTVIDDKTTSSVEGTEDGSEIEELLDGEQPTEKTEVEEDPGVIQTRNTQKRFDVYAEDARNLRAEIAQLKNKAPIDVSSLSEPKPGDFDEGEDDRGYIAAKGAYDGSIATLNLINQSNQKSQQADAVLSTQQKISGYVQKTEAVKKEIPDFEAVVKGTMLDAVDAQGNYTEATIALLEIDNGPEVAYHLAKNSNLAISLNRSTPTQVILTIGRLSQQLSASPAKINDNPPPVGSEDMGSRRGAPVDDLPNLGKATFE